MTGQPRPALGSTMRVLEPAPGVLGFYDGRLPGVRAYSDAPNWLDDGAYELGICTYAILDGAEALVYDTHISLDHARLIRQRLEAAGARHIRVVLSHWHDDHVAGNAVFADCEIIANRLTAELLAANRATIETADPPIRPLVMPNRLFEGSLRLNVGKTEVELRQMDIHSQDGTVMLLPDRGLLFAGDTLEDPITYVAEPGRLEAHLRDLDRLAALPFTRILPDHGDPEIIAAGGYDTGLIGATHRYVERLMLCPMRPDLAAMPLEAFLGADAQAGAIRIFAPYEAVHRRNVAAIADFDGQA
jgi:glyoxylase-like metal-dependent hydrolase (beta-lactamase superfamily II)